jgi:hypothetical protein
VTSVVNSRLGMHAARSHPNGAILSVLDRESQD